MQDLVLLLLDEDADRAVGQVDGEPPSQVVDGVEELAPGVAPDRSVRPVEGQGRRPLVTDLPEPVVERGGRLQRGYWSAERSRTQRMPAFMK